jgi:alkylated DNA repair dioxygenase AlkB
MRVMSYRTPAMQIPTGQTELGLGGVVRFEPGWLERSEADALFNELRTGIVWSQGVISLFGRELREPRLTAWFGDADYTYSGRTVRAAPWPASLATLRARVEHVAHAPFNAALLNLYRDGHDSMGMHSKIAARERHGIRTSPPEPWSSTQRRVPCCARC